MQCKPTIKLEIRLQACIWQTLTNTLFLELLLNAAQLCDLQSQTAFLYAASIQRKMVSGNKPTVTDGRRDKGEAGVHLPNSSYIK